MLKTLQFITFVGLLLVSIGLSIILYTGFSINALSFVVLLIVAFSAETLKVLTLITANTNFYQANQIKLAKLDDFIKGVFVKKNRIKIKDGSLLKNVIAYEKHRKKGYTYIAVYIFTAILSISASFGYITSTINTFSESKVALSTIDTQSIYQDKLRAIDDKIAQDKKLNTEYARDQSVIDTQDTNFQSKYDSYQRKIDKNNDDIQKQLDLKQINNDTLQNLKIKDIDTNTTHQKTVYALMGDALHISAKAVMYILLAMLSMLIEVGIFFTSPAFHKGEEEEKELLSPPLVKPGKIKEIFNKEKEVDIKPEFEGGEKETEELPKQAQEEKEYHEALESLPSEAPVAVPEEPLVRKIDRDKLIDAFIDILFDDKGKMLKREEVAAKVGLPLFHAIKIVDFLTHSALVQFRPPDSFYRTASMEEIKKAMGQLYKGEK